MLSVRLSGPAQDHALDLGPISALLLDGKHLRTSQAAPDLATYEDHQWCVGEQCYRQLTLHSPALVYAEGESQPLGPFDQLRLLDGELRNWDDHGTLVARFDPAGKTWIVFERATTCNALRLIPADVPVADPAKVPGP